jgi:hypothetical protein
MNRSLWKGNIPATYLWVSYSMCQFGFYVPIHELVEIKAPLNSGVSSGAHMGTMWNATVPFVAGAGAHIVHEYTPHNDFHNIILLCYRVYCL